MSAPKNECKYHSVIIKPSHLPAMFKVPDEIRHLCNKEYIDKNDILITVTECQYFKDFSKCEKKDFK